MKKIDKKNDLNEFYNIINPILKSNEFIKRKKYAHHGEISVYDHSLAVSILAYKIAKKFKLNYKDAAIGGLLHDFYRNPWQDNQIKKKFFQKHGFTHANDAYLNASYFYPDYINKKIENIIKSHMFPLNKKLPKFKESWIVSLADKIISLQIFKEPKKIKSYLGFKIKK